MKSSSDESNLSSFVFLELAVFPGGDGPSCAHLTQDTSFCTEELRMVAGIHSRVALKKKN